MATATRVMGSSNAKPLAKTMHIIRTGKASTNRIEATILAPPHEILNANPKNLMVSQIKAITTSISNIAHPPENCLDGELGDYQLPTRYYQFSAIFSLSGLHK